MKLAFDIARRYLIAKKSQNIINVISMISVMGVVTGSMALLVVLSVFNGLHDFIGNLYGAFDPDLKVVPATGKVMSLDSLNKAALENVEGVLNITELLEDQALLKFDKRQMPGVILGVDSVFNKVCGVDSIIIDGSFSLQEKGENRGVLGSILADQMAIRLNFVSPLVIYVPKRTSAINMMSPQNAFQTEYLQPTGVFEVKQQEYDGKYVLVNIQQARRLFEYKEDVVSALGISVDPAYSLSKVQDQIQEITGSHTLVLDKEQQHESFYKMMKVEKLMAFLILSFILVIAAFNIIGTLSMLIFEKKESIFTLKNMGADKQLITRIFLIEGWLISLMGVFVGLMLGVVLVVIQQQFGLVRFQGTGTFITDAYPVKLNIGDILLVLVTVSTIGFLAAWYPVKVIVKRYYSEIVG